MSIYEKPKYPSMYRMDIEYKNNAAAVVVGVLVGAGLVLGLGALAGLRCKTDHHNSLESKLN